MSVRTKTCATLAVSFLVMGACSSEDPVADTDTALADASDAQADDADVSGHEDAPDAAPDVAETGDAEEDTPSPTDVIVDGTHPPDTTPDTVVDTTPDTPDVRPSGGVVVGVGLNDVFVTDGATTMLSFGPQGGFHIWAALFTNEHLTDTPEVDFRATNAEGQSVGGLYLPDIAWQTSDEGRFADGFTVFVHDADNVESFVGEEWTLCVTIYGGPEPEPAVAADCIDIVIDCCEFPP